MDIALTTRWNASRHNDGAAMIDEILAMGFPCVELGYDTRIDLVEGVKRRVAEGAVKVNSLHNFCPVPMGAPRGHPELYTFASRDPRIRALAVQHTAKTIEFAAEVGARVVVTHCGYVEVSTRTDELVQLTAAGQLYSPAYEKAKLRLQTERDKRAGVHLAWVEECLLQLLPVLQQHDVILAMENLPSWEAVPNEAETFALLQRLRTPHLGYWHDTGHGKIRENLGFVNVERWLERLAPYTAGMHLHDVARRIQDHTMPPHGGEVDFARLSPFVQGDKLRVIEPTTRTPREAVVEALHYLQKTLSAPGPDSQTTKETA